MDGAAPPSPAMAAGYSKFNSALTAGLLNPMSPPPPPLDPRLRSSLTLFDMMASEPTSLPPPPAPISTVGLLQRLQTRISAVQSSDELSIHGPGDVHVHLSSPDGLSTSLSLHRHVLASHSRFFSSKLSDPPSLAQQRRQTHLVQIADCDDVEIYVETLRLMYSSHLRRGLLHEPVPRVLSILKVAAAIGFEAGVAACLEHLEAAPWAEDEEERVAAVLSELRLENAGVREVLKRVSPASRPEGVLARLLPLVLAGKDDKARREMKQLVSKMLRECGGGGELAGEAENSLYAACESCLRQLRRSAVGGGEAAEIPRHADNLQWLAGILVEREVAEELLRTWAGETELAAAHCRVPAVHRYEVSRVTATLLVGVGKGKVLVEKEARCQLLRTWLEPLYDDFGWMRRACKGMDRHLVEEGLANTILTLPLPLQQEILLAWFDRFLGAGDDCPNIQRAFEVWWRRAFWWRPGEPEEPPPQPRVSSADIP
ncbi:BTB/POZ domain-containing protein [Wolffia australiana]